MKMDKILYLDLVGGISGDMLVGGFLDLGVPLEFLSDALKQLPLPNVSLKKSRDRRHHISGVRFEVAPFASKKINEYRSYHSIQDLIEKSSLKSSVKNSAISMFKKLAVVEGKIHDQPFEQVQFHEIGAWDSIADVISIAISLDYLKIVDIFVSPIPLGTGVTEGSHGKIPIPAPATLSLLQGFPIIQDSLTFERTTPTGASFIAEFAKPRPPSFCYVVDGVGVGIGNQDIIEVPNILRCILGHMPENGSSVYEELIECSQTNLDDIPGEWLGYLHEQLMAAGAADVWFTPINMKKNRPGIMAQVLHSRSLRRLIHQIIFDETSTLGIRYTQWNRAIIKRKEVRIKTQWGEISGKVSNFHGDVRFSPEFDECRKIALSNHIPLRTVYRVAAKNFFKDLDPKNSNS